MEKIVIITGGSRGIGAATARLAAQQGYSVCVNYRQNREVANKVTEELKELGSTAISVAANIAIESDVI